MQITTGARTFYRPLEADRGASALWQSLEKLHTRAGLMMVTAHPDDEDGGMLAYESREQCARAALLTLNRGESVRAAFMRRVANPICNRRDTMINFPHEMLREIYEQP